MAVCLVTGGAGFIGSHLVEALLARGKRVRVVDDLSTGHLRNLAPYLRDIEFIRGDIRDEDVVRDAVRGVDCIFHEAALVSVAVSVQEPLKTEEINVLATLKLLVSARDAGVRRFVYASSAAVYGNSTELPKHETMNPYPTSPYGFSKLAMEHHGRIFTELHGLETVGLRYFNVMGPRQDPTSPYSGVISKFIAVMSSGAAPTIHGDGLQTRDFVHVSDIVQANLLAAEADMSGGTYNVATGQSYTLLDVVNVLSEIMQKRVEPTFAPTRAGDIRHSAADISAIRRHGYHPSMNLHSGLADTVKWYRTHAN